MNFVFLAGPPAMQRHHGDLRLSLFDVQSPIGQGPLSVASKAVLSDSDPGSPPMVLKSYNRTQLSVLQIRQIQQQAILAGSLTDYSCIVPIYGLFEDEGTSKLFLITKYAERGNLYDEMARNRGRLSDGRVVQISRALLSALKQIHGRGLTHGNIKPENVLLGPTDDNVYLSDLGLNIGVRGPTTPRRRTSSTCSNTGAISSASSVRGGMFTTTRSPGALSPCSNAFGAQNCRMWEASPVASPSGSAAAAAAVAAAVPAGAPREKRVSFHSGDQGTDLAAAANLIYNTARGFTSPSEFLHHLDGNTATQGPLKIVGTSPDLAGFLEAMMDPLATANDLLRHPFLSPPRPSCGDVPVAPGTARSSSAGGRRSSSILRSNRASIENPRPATRQGSRVRFEGETLEDLLIQDLDEVTKAAADALNNYKGMQGQQEPQKSFGSLSAVPTPPLAAEYRRASVDSGAQAFAATQAKAAAARLQHTASKKSLNSGRASSDGRQPSQQIVDWAAAYKAKLQELNSMAASANLPVKSGTGQDSTDRQHWADLERLQAPFLVDLRPAALQGALPAPRTIGINQGSPALGSAVPKRPLPPSRRASATTAAQSGQSGAPFDGAASPHNGLNTVQSLPSQKLAPRTPRASQALLAAGNPASASPAILVPSPGPGPAVTGTAAVAGTAKTRPSSGIASFINRILRPKNSKQVAAETSAKAASRV